MTRPLLVALLLCTAWAAPATAETAGHRIGVTAAAGVLGDRSTAGLQASALMRLKGRLVLDLQVDLYAWWNDMAGEMGRSSPYVVGGLGARGGIGAGIAVMDPGTPTQLFATLGVGPRVWRVAEGDRTELVAEADRWISLAAPAGWVSLVPYLRFTFDIPVTDLMGLVGHYEFAVDRQLTSIEPPAEPTLSWVAPPKVREPHLTRLEHRLRLGIAIRPSGTVGFVLALEPALAHGFVDRADTDDLDTSRIQPTEAGMAFHVGAWIAI